MNSAREAEPHTSNGTVAEDKRKQIRDEEVKDTDLENRLSFDDPIVQQEREKVSASNWASKIKSVEIVAEQIVPYFFPGISHKGKMQVLMFFEMAKVFFRLKNFFSGSETLLMEDKIFVYFMADHKRQALLSKRAENIIGLFKLHSKIVGPDKLLEKIHKVLSLKVVEKKKEVPKENEHASSGLNGVDPLRSDALAIMPPSADPQPLEYVIDKESVIDSFIFNEELEAKLPRNGTIMGLLKSLPIPERLKKNISMPSRVKASECLYILRPLLYCMMASLHEESSFKPVIFSAVMDAVILLLRLNYKRQSVPEIEELKQRNRELLYVYLLREPIYSSFVRPRLIEPIVRKFVKWDTVANLIMQSIDFRTSYSLVL